MTALLAEPSRLHPRPDGAVPLFVYGTLRPGGGLYPYYLADAATHVAQVAAPGGLFLVSARGGYPVWVREVEGEVRGDLFLVDPAAFADTRRMEEGAGYRTVETEVRYLDEERATAAWAFAYPAHYPRGPRIASGDWFDHAPPRARTSI